LQTIKGFDQVLSHLNAQSFDSIALELFQFQAKNNPVYAQYLEFLKIDPTSVHQIDKIPFLPISFFKTQKVKTGDWEPEVIFTSSGTTGSVTSQHLVRSLSGYQQHSKRIFEQFFGPLSGYHFLALLPSYLERQGSSLIYMVDYFIKETGSPHSGFYLHDIESLVRKLHELRNSDRKIILIGVSFALLDLAEKMRLDLSHCVVMETGGMKGRRQELTRDELHGVLKSNFNLPNIHSEYGMTELLSQAYSTENGVFKCPSGMKILIRDISDPFSKPKTSQTGIINVIDLGNFNTCSFIETQDLGRVDQNGYFEVLGRMDNSDVRGCNLLVG
jgi:phenylacetate-coenzyme A ligase PaaK-like adenylate-forming protein